MIFAILLLVFLILIPLYFRLWFKLSDLEAGLRRSSTLMLHNISHRFDFSVSALKQEKFSQFIESAQNEGLGFASLESLFSEEKIAPAARVLRLTFDDGYEGIYHLFREHLEPRSLPLTIFMVTGYMGQQATWDYRRNPSRHLALAELKELAQSPLVTIGSHSVTHPDLTRLLKSRLGQEIVDSKRFLEDNLGSEIKYFSYPFGRFNRKVIDVVREAGYQAALCGVPFRLERQHYLFAIPRIPLNVFDNLFTFRQKVNLGRLAWLEFSKARVIEQFSAVTFDFRGRDQW